MLYETTTLANNAKHRTRGVGLRGGGGRGDPDLRGRALAGEPGDMSRRRKVTNLEQLLDRIDEAARDSDEVTLVEVLDEVGRRSFGPLLLLAGVIVLTPVIGDVPGMPTLIGAFVFLVAVQLVFGREHFWLPRWLLERSVSGKRLRKGLKRLRSPARLVDRPLRPRLGILVEGPAGYAVATVCLVIAVMMPAMEFVPPSSTGGGAALTAFGLSLIAHDGLLALIAFVFTAGAVGLVGYSLLG